MTKQTSRRAVLAGAAAAIPTTAIGGLSDNPPTTDPIFAAIEKVRILGNELDRLYGLLQDAEEAAREIHGHRPIALIAWRIYSHIGGSEIEGARERFLGEPHAVPEAVELEYRDAKDRYQAALDAEEDWDEQAGLADQRRECARLGDELEEARMELVRTRLATPKGAGAMIALVAADLEDGEMAWHVEALRTAAAALGVMPEVERRAVQS